MIDWDGNPAPRRHTAVPGQLSFDIEEARLARERGMAQADAATRVQLWKEAADEWFENLLSGRRFTADDLVEAVQLPGEGANRNNVVGAWFSGKSRLGLIAWTGSYRSSARVVRHANFQREWEKT